MDYLHIFNPSQTNHVKHFISSCAYNHATVTPAALNLYAGGYVNSTSAIDDIKFYTRSGGNIDSGDFIVWFIVNFNVKGEYYAKI